MSDDARARILAAAVSLLLESGNDRVTVEAVADRAGCAKGLVAYHFKTKAALFREADGQVSARRRSAWTVALRTTSPQTAIDSTWQVIRREASDGTARYAVDKLTDWSDSDSLAYVVGKECVALLRRAGRTPTVAEGELADLCAVTLPGFAASLAGGADHLRMESAYAAFWAGLFALTRAA